MATKLRNLTPHDVNLMVDDVVVLTIPSEGMARCDEQRDEAHPIGLRLAFTERRTESTHQTLSEQQKLCPRQEDSKRTRGESGSGLSTKRCCGQLPETAWRPLGNGGGKWGRVVGGKVKKGRPSRTRWAKS